MAKKTISSALETALVANEPFEYAHLVKFERPFISSKGVFRTNANRYVYVTDAQRDITYDGNVYRAHGVLNVGSFSETTQARATNMTLSLSGEQIGTEVTATGTFTTSGVFNATTTVIDGEVLDFVELGFREGDLIEVKRFNNLNFSDGSTQKRFVISSFSNNNQSITFARTGTDSDDSAFLGTELASSTLIFSLVNQEYRAPFLEKSTTATNSATITNSTTITLTAANSKINIGQLVSGRGIPDETVVTSVNGTTLKINQAASVLAGKELKFTSPSFINREVFIHKAFINPETGAFFGTPVLNFKGIIASVNIQENAQASRVQWSLTSHWGDFAAVTGRLGTDEIHRALDSNGISNPNLTVRPEYAGDLGFLHAESSLNTIANYQTTETRTRLKSKKRGGLAGLMGQRKYYQEEYQVQVDNEVDLSVYLQGRYIPVVYGVQRIAGVPIFADTLNNNSKVVYVAYTLAEGEIHGVYNMYIDGAPLICVDKNDSDVRSSTATNSDSQSLQCYGRMDKGDTLGGVNANASATQAAFSECEKLAKELEREDVDDVGRAQIISNCYERVTKTVNSSDLSALYANATAEGLQHEESAKISHPFAMEFEFHSGRANQAANNLLATQANSNNFKRQNDYYTGNQPYWGPNHRLLDTAYVVMKFTIEADQTTIPEVEYVIKGKVLENYNFDGTYVPSPAPNQSQSTDNFNEGDTVTVEVSSNGTSWGSDGNGNYRILDKYFMSTSRGTQQPRFRLDKLPEIGDNTHVRLKNSSNQYWEMITYDHGIALGGDTIPSQTIQASSIQTNSSGVLTATLTSAGQTKLTSLYGSEATNVASTSRIFLKFIGASGEFGSLENVTLQGLYSGNTITFPETDFTANQTLSGVTIVPDRLLDLSSDLGTYTAAEVEGLVFKNLDTGEEKEIVDYNTSTKVIELESGFAKTPLTTHNYTIKGGGRDLRASTNPAIQTADLLTNERYGKALSITNDIDLDSVRQAARACDSRSDVTIPLASATTCVAGDIYKLVDANGDHVASGKVKTSTTNESSVTLTDVSGKFSRVYKNYITYRLGDIVTNIVNGETRYYKVTSTNNSTGANRGVEPTHTTSSGSGSGGFLYLNSAISLSRVSGSGPTSISLAVDGRIIQYSLYDADFVKYWRYLGWEENRQWCVTRHQTNFIFATERSIFENINALLSHYNGILSYSNGKYILDVETSETAPASTNTFNSVDYDWNVNPEYIDNSDIIGGITINDNSQKNAKNTIKASIADPQNNFSSRSVSFFNSDFLKADRNVIKTGNYPVTGITSYYNARIGIEKELIQSRYSKEISFTVGQKGLLLKPGAVIAITYDPFEFSSKLFRIENLTHNANCTTSIKAREYSDEIYAITPQIANKSQESATAGDFGLAIPGTPSSLSTSNTKPGVITLNWSNASDYKEVIDSTEVWRASSQGSSGDITSHATLLTIVDNATTFSDAVGSAGTFYYWIRHRRLSRRTSDNAAVKLVGSFSTAIGAGVSGVAKVPSAQLDVDVASAQIKFNASNVLTPGGTNQDVKLTATLRGITASNVTFTLVDADASTTASDVTFTNSNASVVDSSAPYEATIDASSFSHNTENKFVKVTCTDTASSEVFTELIPIAVVKDGSSGSVGIDAKAIKLTPSTHVVSYSATGGENTTVTFTTETQGTSGFSGTANYQFLVGGVLKATNTTGQFTLADSDEPAANASVNVVVKLFDGTPSGSPEATDSVTIFGVKDGSDAISTFLTNAAHVVPTDNAGAIDSSLVSSGDITSAGGTFKVFIGATDRTTACTYAVQSESGVDATIGANTGAYTISSTGLSDLGTATFRVTIPSNVSPTGTQLTIDRVYSIAKSKKGNAGAAGTNAKTVQLTAADYSVVYDEDGSNPSPSGTITLTASHKNFSNPVYQFVVDGTAGSFASSSTGSFSIPSSIFNTPKTMQVNVKESGGSSTEAFDSISIFGVKSGSNAYTVIIDNEAHAIPADNDGSNPVLTGSGCTISVFKGSTELNGITSGTPSSGQFKVAVSSDTNITAGSQTSSGNPVVFADHSSLTAATANIVYSINVENTQTVLKKQSFTRVDKGDDSRNSAEVKIYKRSNNSTATSNEAVPNNNTTYTFSTGAWPGSGNQADGWSLTQPTSGGLYMWSTTAKAIGTAGADTATIAEADWATPTRLVVEDPRVATRVIYYDAWNYGAAPSNPSIVQGSFNFTTGNFTALPTGWSQDIATLPYYVLVVTITEATFGGTQTYSFSGGRGIGEWRGRDPRDLVIEMDDSAHEVKVRAGSDLSYAAEGKASIPAKYKNDSIEISTANIGTNGGARVTLKKYGSETDTADITKSNMDLQFFDGANKTEFDTLSSTDGSIGIKNNNAGSFTELKPFSTSELTKLTNLRAGKNPANSSQSILNNDIDINASGEITGINTAGVKVNNQKITVSNGLLSGIGTGNNTVVDNNSISLTLNQTPGDSNQGQLTIGRGGSLGNLTTTFDIDTLPDAGVTKSGAAKADTIIDGSNRIKATTQLIDSGGQVKNVNNMITQTKKVEATIDSSNRFFGTLYDSTNDRTRSIINIADALDSSGRIVGSVFSGGTSFTPAELINVRSTFLSVDNSSNIKFNPAKVPLNNTFLEVASDEIKIKDQAIDTAQIKDDAIEGSKVNSATTITAGSSNNVAVLDGADSTYRIYAGHATATSAPFQVKQTGEVNVTSFNVNTGTSEKTIRFRPADPTNIFFAVGDSDPTDAPLRVKSVSNVSQVEIDNLKLYKDDGTTLMFDSSVGFTDAAFTQIAANVGSSNAGSTVTTVDNSNLINPFTSIGGSTASTTAGSQVRFQKVTLFSPLTLTVKAVKDANFFKTGDTINDALGKIPSVVKMRIGYSTNSNLSSPTYIAELGQSNTDGQNTNSNIGNGVSRITSGTPTSTQYEINTVTESEPGFQISISSLVDQSGDAVNDSDDFEISDTRQYSGSSSGTDYYFFIEVTGTISQSQTGGASDISASAGRELVITASGGGSFSVDSDGNVQPSGGGTNITSISGTAPIVVSGSGASRTISLGSGVSYSSSTLDITGSAKVSSAYMLGSINLIKQVSSVYTFGSVDDDDINVSLKGFGGNSQFYLADGDIFVNGTSNSTAAFKFGSDGHFHSNGDVIAYSSTLTASDERLKENISPLQSSLEKITNLQGVKYDWKDKDKGTEQLGLIAQEVEKVIPEVVDEITDGLGDLNDMKVVNYVALIPVLIEAVKELKEEIKELKKDK